MKSPELINATEADLDELLALAKSTFPQEQYQLLEGVFGTFVHLMRGLQNAKTSIKRLRQMLFGASTEHKRTRLKGSSGGATGDQPAATDPAAEAAPANAAAEPSKASGHGRNGANAYSDSPVVDVTLTDLQSGDPCPTCVAGKVDDSPPLVIVKVVGTPPLTATVFKVQRLRCRLCDAIFTAPLPEGLSLAKYDHRCASLLAVLRYGSGMPFYRLEGLQASLNVPLPDATQWDIVAAAIPGPRAARDELIRQAAQAPLLHNDDTPARILNLMKERARAEAAGQTVKARAINTSGIVAALPLGQKVVLFFTGHAHAGQNMAQVLVHRAAHLDAPMQMSDALACNFAGEFKSILGQCLTHGRRKFVDVLEHFPEPCCHVIEVLAQVYANEAHGRDEKLSPEQRLIHHPSHSGPPMQALHDWMHAQLDQCQVEPNSGLGQALRYMIKHWSGLTLFLRKEGAPLDNNSCERALKRAILHRKNSMFYKSINGADVGDSYMSLIHTCALCKVNPFEYLQALQAHAEAVIARAALWLPWNYREQLTATA